MSLKPFLVLEWVVDLRKRHGSGLEPAVQHLGNTAHDGLARGIVRVRTGQLINVRTVQRRRTAAEVALQLIQGTIHIHAWVLVVIRDPHWDRRTPVAVTGDVPIAGVFQPLAKLAIADVLRQPLDLIVVQLHHPVAELRHGHEPGRQSHVDQRLTRAPRVRVGVLDRLVADHLSGFLEVLDDLLVGVENKEAFVLRNEGGELAVHVHGDDYLDAGGVAGVHIVLTEGRGLVDDARAVFGGDVVRTEDLERVGVIAEVAEDRLVGQADQLCAGVLANHSMVLAELLSIRAH